MESFRNYLLSQVNDYRNKIKIYEKHYKKYMILIEKYNNFCGWITGKKRRCENMSIQAAKLSDHYYRKVQNILKILNKKPKRKIKQ